MYRLSCLLVSLLILLSAFSACSLSPEKPDCSAELVLGDGQTLGYNLSISADADGNPCALAEFVFYFNGQLYETGPFELLQLLNSQYRVAVAGQGWTQYRQFVFTDGTHRCVLEEIKVDVEADACYGYAHVPEGFDPAKAVLDTQRTDGAGGSPAPEPEQVQSGQFPVGETQADYTAWLEGDFSFISQTLDRKVSGSAAFKKTYASWNIQYSQSEGAYILRDSDTGTRWRICLDIDGEPVEIPKGELIESRIQTVEGKLMGFSFDFSLGDRFEADSKIEIYVEMLK